MVQNFQMSIFDKQVLETVQKTMKIFFDPDFRIVQFSSLLLSLDEI